MKYYAGHEEVYRRLEREGHSCWDKRGFDDFFMKPFFVEALRRMTFATTPPRALELGCGTGPGACLLAQNGFTVTGIDISDTAIRTARKMAAERGLTIDYRVSDICSLDAPKSFDLVVDSHALHCIVTDEDRRATYEGIRRTMADGGYFITETMAACPAMKFTDNFRYVTDGTLWVSVAANHPLGATQIDGKWYLPNRRILPVEALTAELLAAGFTIEWSNVVDQSAANQPAELQAICRAA